MQQTEILLGSVDNGIRNKPLSTDLNFGDTDGKTVDLNLRFGFAEVNDNNIKLTVLPDNKIEYEDLASTKIFEEIYQSMLAGKDTIIYIHGFNTSFADSLKTGGKIKEQLKALSNKLNDVEYDPNIFVFTWPSGGNLLAYLHDRYEAEVSGTALARGLVKLKNFITNKKANCGSKIHLITHSMGAYALRNTILSLPKIPESFSGRLFEEILMFSADEERDCFEDSNKMASLPEYTQRITVYFNNGDLALSIGSKMLKLNGERLGTDGTKKTDIDRKIVLVDTSEVVTNPTYRLELGAIIEHSYIFDEEVLLDAYQVLKGKFSARIEGRDFSLNDKKYILKRNKSI